MERLIADKNIDTFLFGSKSQFDSLCHEVVTKLRKKHPHIKRIFVRAEYPFIGDDYLAYLLEAYEDTYFPEHLTNAGKASYVERNCEMIEKSRVCIVYYDPDYTPQRRKASQNAQTDHPMKSGTRIAYEYALKKNKCIINVLDKTVL